MKSCLAPYLDSNWEKHPDRKTPNLAPQFGINRCHEEMSEVTPWQMRMLSWFFADGEIDYEWIYRILEYRNRKVKENTFDRAMKVINIF